MSPLSNLFDPNPFVAVAAALSLVSVGAVYKVVSRFLKHVEKKDEQFTTFLGNHMSGNTKALANLTAATQRLADEVHGWRMEQK